MRSWALILADHKQAVVVCDHDSQVLAPAGPVEGCGPGNWAAELEWWARGYCRQVRVSAGV